MRNIQTIDGELGLLVAIRHMVREADGRSPGTAQIDGLLDERAAVTAGAVAATSFPAGFGESPWETVGHLYVSHRRSTGR